MACALPAAKTQIGPLHHLARVCPVISSFFRRPCSAKRIRSAASIRHLEGTVKRCLCVSNSTWFPHFAALHETRAVSLAKQGAAEQNVNRNVSRALSNSALNRVLHSRAAPLLRNPVSRQCSSHCLPNRSVLLSRELLFDSYLPSPPLRNVFPRRMECTPN